MDELEVPPAKRRFSTVSEADMASACNAKVPKATKSATCFWLKMFKSFCEESSVVIDLATCLPSELESILCCFYLGGRIKNGEYYKQSSLTGANPAFQQGVQGVT